MSENTAGQSSAADEPTPAKLHKVFAKANLPATVQKVPGRHCADFFWPQDHFADALVTPEQLKLLLLEHYRQVLVIASVDGQPPAPAPGQPSQPPSAEPSLDKSKIPSAVLAELASGKNETTELKALVRTLTDRIQTLETSLGDLKKTWA